MGCLLPAAIGRSIQRSESRIIKAELRCSKATSRESISSQAAVTVVCWKRKWFVECAGLSGLHGLYGGRDRSERHHFASRRLIATVFNKPPVIGSITTLRHLPNLGSSQ